MSPEAEQGRGSDFSQDSPDADILIGQGTDSYFHLGQLRSSREEFLTSFVLDSAVILVGHSDAVSVIGRKTSSRRRLSFGG